MSQASTGHSQKFMSKCLCRTLRQQNHGDVKGVNKRRGKPFNLARGAGVSSLWWRVEGVRCGVESVGFWIKGAGLKVEGLRSRVKGVGLRV